MSVPNIYASKPHAKPGYLQPRRANNGGSRTNLRRSAPGNADTGTIGVCAEATTERRYLIPISLENTIRHYNLDDDDSDSSFTGGDLTRHRHRRKRFKPYAMVTVMVLFFLMLLYIPMVNHVQSRMGSISGWSYNTSRRTSEYVLPKHNTSIIDPHNGCTSSATSIFLLIVVCTAPENVEERKTIRETWGNTTEFNYPLFARVHSHLSGHYLNANDGAWESYAVASDGGRNLSETHFNIRVLFLVGQTSVNETQSQLYTENDMFGDIIQESFVDSYNNLTLKTIMMLKWVTSSCLDKAKFVMKCDDDTFVNVPNLIHILLGGTVPVYDATAPFHDEQTVKSLQSHNRLPLLETSKSSRLLIGYLFCKAKPIADITSKWYSPHYMFRGDVYPNYLSGSGYVMGMKAAELLYRVTLRTSVFHLEDVYLTGICALKAHLKPRHNPLFIYKQLSNPCAMKGMVTQHQLPSADLKSMYEFVTNTSAICPPVQLSINRKKLLLRRAECL